MLKNTLSSRGKTRGLGGNCVKRVIKPLPDKKSAAATAHPGASLKLVCALVADQGRNGKPSSRKLRSRPRIRKPEINGVAPPPRHELGGICGLKGLNIISRSATSSSKFPAASCPSPAFAASYGDIHKSFGRPLSGKLEAVPACPLRG